MKTKIKYSKERFQVLAALFYQVEPAEYDGPASQLCALHIKGMGVDMAKKLFESKSSYTITLKQEQALALLELYQELALHVDQYTQALLYDLYTTAQQLCGNINNLT